MMLLPLPMSPWEDFRSLYRKKVTSLHRQNANGTKYGFMVEISLSVELGG